MASLKLSQVSFAGVFPMGAGDGPRVPQDARCLPGRGCPCRSPGIPPAA
jgi:hypothetical protein